MGTIRIFTIFPKPIFLIAYVFQFGNSGTNLIVFAFKTPSGTAITIFYADALNPFEHLTVDLSFFLIVLT